MAEQVGKFLTELPELETPTDGDLMYIVDAEASANSASKKITMSNLKRVLGGNVTGTVEDASVSFSDGADGIPMEECEVTIVPTQDLHGYSKPWAGGAGKNKWNEDYTGISATITYKAIYVGDGTFTCSTTCPLSGQAANVFFLAGNVSSGAASATNGVSNNAPITQTSNGGYVTIAYRNDFGLNPEDYNTMIESGSLATQYEPYSNICPISGHSSVTVTVASTSGGSGEDTTVSLGRTVYKGWVNLSTGEGAITGASVDLGSQTYTYDAQYSRFYTYVIADMKVVTNRTMPLVCSCYETIDDGRAVSDVPNGSIYAVSEKRLYIHDNRTTSPSDLATALNNQTCVYELATPQTFTLTKEQIQTLLGQNYVSHDGGGNIKVVYIRDLDITINDLIDRVTALENE